MDICNFQLHVAEAAAFLRQTLGLKPGMWHCPGDRGRRFG